MAWWRPDPLNYGWRDYGPRVGFWRVLDPRPARHPRLCAAQLRCRRTQSAAHRGRRYPRLRYVLDWTNDDQPYRLNVPGMSSVPYSVELNDIGLFVSKSLSGPDFVQIVRDQTDQLYADSADSGRVMALALHPFVIGQAFRASTSIRRSSTW
jgi:hypothetical protein